MLQDPASAIPKGTMLALLISMTSYITFVLFAGAAAVRDASGNLTDVVNGTVIPCTENCHYGLFNSYSVGIFIFLYLTFTLRLFLLYL